MAGAAFEVEFQDHRTLERLAMLARSVADLRPAMDAIGNAIRGDIDLTFSAEEDPYGNPWEKLKTATIAARRKGKREGYRDKILRDTGILSGSQTFNAGGGPDFGEQIVGKDYVIVGTNVVYAATHQFGDDDRNIPARPFLPLDGLPADLEDEIYSITTKFIQKALR